MNPTPVVSVILPILQRPERIDAVLGSVLRQNFSDLELIVIDAAVDSGIKQAISRLAPDDKRVIYQPCMACSAAAISEVALKSARGHWIAYLHDADEWLLDRLARQVELADRLGAECDLVAGRLFEYLSAGKVRLHKWTMQSDNVWLDPQQRFGDGTKLIRTALIRRSIWQALLPFDPLDASPQNFEWGLRLLRSRRTAAVAQGVAVLNASCVDARVLDFEQASGRGT